MNANLKAYLSAYQMEVTGSRFLLRIEFPFGEVKRILIDCGYFQEIEYRVLNYVHDLDPRKIDAIIVTHNHIDHTGLIPKMVREGFSGPIYMTSITRELVGDFWLDCAAQQEENTNYLKQKFPNDAWQFKPLFYNEDVNKAKAQSIGLPFRKEFEIIPGVYVTYYENGHLLGAGMIHLRIAGYGKKDIEYFFTGDYKPYNPFFKVPPLPKKLLRKDLIIVCESTYGSTRSDEIKYVLKRNLMESLAAGKNILIGAFAQGRMQEMLLLVRRMQDEGLIPSGYRICYDGNLGIKTTQKYISILEWYNKPMADFLPKNLEVVDAKARGNILNDNRPVLLITTSGMLSNGPAVTYVPIFLSDPNSVIHLVGYAAEETIARDLLESKHESQITIRGETYVKRAKVFTTRECTSHATEDQLLDLIRLFEHPVMVLINHGATSVQKEFQKAVSDECENVPEVDFINRNTMYHMVMMGSRRTWELKIKKMPSKLNKFGWTKKSEQAIKRSRGSKHKGHGEPIRRSYRKRQYH
jgi:metallo-beta-lactamase family protein